MSTWLRTDGGCTISVEKVNGDFTESVVPDGTRILVVDLGFEDGRRVEVLMDRKDVVALIRAFAESDSFIREALEWGWGYDHE